MKKTRKAGKLAHRVIGKRINTTLGDEVYTIEIVDMDRQRTVTYIEWYLSKNIPHPYGAHLAYPTVHNTEDIKTLLRVAQALDLDDVELSPGRAIVNMRMAGILTVNEVREGK